jgi:hypothetical protein
MGVTKALNLPVQWCGVSCAEAYEAESSDRDDLIVLLHRDLGLTPTQIVIYLEGIYDLSRQLVWHILKENGVLAS